MRLKHALLRRLSLLPVLLWPVLLSSCSSQPSSPPPQPVVLNSPYLQAVTSESVYVLIERETIEPVSVEYGPTESYGHLASTETTEITGKGTFIHNVKLTGLAADTLYHYRLAGQTDGWTFWTAAPPGTAFRLAWFADCRMGRYIHDIIARRIDAMNPRFSLYGGDLCNWNRYEDFRRDFFIPAQLALASRVPFFNAAGNHEFGPDLLAFTQAPASGSGVPDYYSFNYGDLHVLVLNTELPYGPGSAQYAFAQADLEAATANWKIVAVHKPPYCAGGHAGLPGLQTMAGGIFEPYGVDVVLSAHSHFYQHNRVNGLEYLVVGSAGALLYFPETAPYTVMSVRSYCFAILDVSPSVLRIAVYDEYGMLLEEIQLTPLSA